jgi:hypothetical protein
MAFTNADPAGIGDGGAAKGDRLGGAILSKNSQSESKAATTASHSEKNDPTLSEWREWPAEPCEAAI